MNWCRIFAYLTGTVDQELLLRNEHLIVQNKILRKRLIRRLQLASPERRTLAQIDMRVGRQVLAEVANLVTPDTILPWYQKLVASKFDGSGKRRYPGRPRKPAEVQKPALRLARENRSLGFRRIVGAMAHLRIQASHKKAAAILRRHGLDPAPSR